MARTPERSGRPLAGLTVVVTRPAEQATSLAEPLAARGAEVVLCPTIRVVPAPLGDELRAAVTGLGSYDMVVFTSANAARYFLDRMLECGVDSGALSGALVVAIGPATEGALAERGVAVGLVPGEAVAEGVVAALGERAGGLQGSRVLMPRAREAREVIPDALLAAGAQVDVVVVYETVAEERLVEPLERLAAADFIVFTSGSTARQLVTLAAVPDLAQRLAATRVVSIGPATSEVLLELGFAVHVEAAEHTSRGVVAAIVAVCS